MFIKYIEVKYILYMTLYIIYKISLWQMYLCSAKVTFLNLTQFNTVFFYGNDAITKIKMYGVILSNLPLFTLWHNSLHIIAKFAHLPDLQNGKTSTLEDIYIYAHVYIHIYIHILSNVINSIITELIIFWGANFAILPFRVCTIFLGLVWLLETHI